MAAEQSFMSRCLIRVRVIGVGMGMLRELSGSISNGSNFHVPDGELDRIKSADAPCVVLLQSSSRFHLEQVPMAEMHSQHWHSCSKLLWPIVCVLLVHLIIQTNGPGRPQAHAVTMGSPRKVPPVCDVSYTPGTAKALNSTSTQLELYHSTKRWLRPWSR